MGFLLINKEKDEVFPNSIIIGIIFNDAWSCAVGLKGQELMVQLKAQFISPLGAN